MIKKTPVVAELMLSIEVASWSGDRQLNWIQKTGFSEDEIALQLEDLYCAAKAQVTHDEGEEFPEFLDEGIWDILNLFTDLIDVDRELWSPESMRTAEQWEVIRARARRLLEEIRASSWAQFLERGMGVELDPPRGVHFGVGAVQLGMPFDAAERICKEIPGLIPPEPGMYQNKGTYNYESGLTISLDVDRSDAVNAVEVFYPERSVQVMFRGISVFEESAEYIIDWLTARHRVEIEDDGLDVTAPDVLIGFWRRFIPEDTCDGSGYYFESAFVATPGFVDIYS